MKTRFVRNKQRRGTVLVLTVMFLMVFFAFLAMVVDIGYLTTAKAELQRTADSAALAACWDYAVRANASGDTENNRNLATTYAATMSTNNPVCGAGPSLPTSDVSWGYLANFRSRTEPLNTAAPLSQTNAVELTIRRSSTLNGRIPSFFAKALGVSGFEAGATATAGICRNVAGFTTPAGGGNLGVLPIALDETTWTNLLAGSGTDSYRYDPVTKTVSSGTDGVLECNLYPQGTGSPGNRGTIDIGSSGNSTADLARQIVDGISPEDMEYHDGELVFDEDGELVLNGDTGISAGIKDELESIKGQPRVIPIFRTVVGPGNNADFTIVRWAGIRILYVKLTGSNSSKRLIIQPAAIVINGVVPATETTVHSNYVYSPAILVR